MTVTPVWTRSGSVLKFCALTLLLLGATSCGVTSPSDESAGDKPRVVPRIIRSALITGADTCAAATLSTESFDEEVTISDTTVGQTDDLNLPDADDPSCTAAPECTGTGSGSPRGVVWQGSGTGPDRAFRFQVSAAINLTASMLSSVDLGLYLFSGSCTSQLSSCSCVSDNAFADMPEVISSIQAVPGVDYYLVVDGYLDPTLGGTPTSGAFDLTISETVIPVCGNDAIEGTEVCDDGNTDDCDGCRADCTAEETGCGDGFLCGAEECDDSNETSGDGCSATCNEEFTTDPSDGGTPALDASTGNPSGGTNGNGGTGNDAGSSNGNEAGTGNDADGGPEAAGGNSGAGGSNGNQVKGGGTRAGAGGTGGEANPPAATANDESSGCVAANAPATSNSGWWVLAGLISLSAVRRRRAQPVLKLAALSSLAVACGLTQQDDVPSNDAWVGGQSVMPRVVHSALTGADTCEDAELTVDSLDEPLVIMDTTVGETDDVDVPDSPSESSCTAATQCTGTGTTPGGRGTVWAGAGTGPDKAYRFQVNSTCTLSVTMLPDAVDLGVYLFNSNCLSDLSSCACISDNAVAGIAETITDIEAEPGVDYYLLVDGYQNPPPATDPPSEGTYTLTITRTAGTCDFVGGCGDNAMTAGEACDDGNTESCDGCSADCSIEETGCGDDVRCGDEECDDGNTDDGDGCSATCREETSTPIDSGIADAAVASTDSGAGGAANGGQGGTTNAPDAAVSASGSNSIGKGGQQGHGGTPPLDNQPAAPAVGGEDDGGGCASSGSRPLPSSAWLTLCGLVSLAAMRRRIRAKCASARVT